jgi:hypothetical protein
VRVEAELVPGGGGARVAASERTETLCLLWLVPLAPQAARLAAPPSATSRCVPNTAPCARQGGTRETRGGACRAVGARTPRSRQFGLGLPLAAPQAAYLTSCAHSLTWIPHFQHPGNRGGSAPGARRCVVAGREERWAPTPSVSLNTRETHAGGATPGVQARGGVLALRAGGEAGVLRPVRSGSARVRGLGRCHSPRS